MCCKKPLPAVCFLLLSLLSGSSLAQQEKFRLKLDFGYRWEVGFDGNRDLYRSQLDYGEGPKLFGGEFSASSLRREKWFFDEMEGWMGSWGGEPYNTARVRALRKGVLKFDFDYRNIRYFNSIPYFANPLWESGSLVSQHQSDFSQRFFRFRADFLPGKKVSPFVSFERSSRHGPIRTTLRADGDEFLVQADTDDHADQVQFGVSYHVSKLALVVEQGLRWFRDRAGFRGIGPQEGNSSRPVFGQDLVLTSYEAHNNVDVFTPFSSAFLTYKPVRKLALRASGSYSIADLDTEFRDQIQGNFFSFPPLAIFYSRGDLTASGKNVKRPTFQGDFSADFQPLSRLRIIERFSTRRLHVASAASILSRLQDVRPVLGGNVDDPLELGDVLTSFFAMNLDTQELTGFYGFGPFQVHVGHRYQRREIERNEQFRAEQNVVILGAAYRLATSYRVSAEYEYGRTDQPIYRLDRVDFQRLRVSGEARPFGQLRISGNALIFSNDDDLDSLDVTQRTRDLGAGFEYTPAPRFSVSGSFQRTRFRSDLIAVVPQTFLPTRSFFRERGNYGEVYLNIGMPQQVALSVGYSVWGTSGNFPNTYHRPSAKIEVPLGERLSAYARWNYYGYNDKLEFMPQDYRTHQAIVGLQLELDKAGATTSGN